MTSPPVETLLQEGIAAAKATWQGVDPAGDVPASKEELRAHAEGLLRQVVEADQANAKAWLWLSTVVVHPDDRLICLTNAASLEPDNPVAQKGLALLKQKMGQTDDRTESDFRSGQAERQPNVLPPRPPEAYHPCPFCHQQISASDTRCRHCETPLVVECPSCNTLIDVEWDRCADCGYQMPDHRLGAVYFTLLATEYKERHRLSKALETLQIAERLDPDQPDIYRQIGEVQAELSEPVAAIATLETAVKKEPEQIGPYLALGRVLQQEGRWEQAEMIYRRAMATVPNSSEPYYALGDLLLHHNRLNESARHLKRATKLDPEHGLAWARLGQLYELTQKPSAAGRAYRRAVRLLPRDTIDGQRAWERLQVLDPGLPINLAMGWSVFFQHMAGPVLIALLVIVIDSWLNNWSIIWADGLAFFLAVFGAFLGISGFSLPRNPIARLLMGRPEGIELLNQRGSIGVLGVLLWILALGIVLLPLA